MINNKSLLYILINLLLLVLIYFSYCYFSEIAYFYSDNQYFQYLHNISLNKKLLEIYSDAYNLNGISVPIINPSLNFLSRINFNLHNENGFIYYITILRILELIVVFIYAFFFIKENKFKITFYILFFFYITIYNFSGFDHNSYISLPIIIFNFTIALSLYFQNKKFILATLHVIGNFVAFMINPMYFFIACFLPLIFLYIYFLLKKKYSQIVIIFIANLPFALWFSMVSLGTARIGVYGELKDLDTWYNFDIFDSKIFLLLSIITIVNCIKITSKKMGFEIKIFFLITLFTTIGGLIWKYKIIKWQLPQPRYFDYSFQYIYIYLFAHIFVQKKNDLIKKISFIILLSIFFYKAQLTVNSLINHKNTISIESRLAYNSDNSNKNLIRRFFWEQDNSLFFKEDLVNKNILLDIPNINSELFRSIWKNNNDLNLDQKLLLLKYQYNTDYGHSLWHLNFNRDLARTNLGHSYFMDISTYRSNSEENKKYIKEYIPPISYDSPLNYILNTEYILSDKIYNLKIKKIYNFSEYKIYLYETNKEFNNEVKKIVKIDDYNKDYKKNIVNFKNNLYLDKSINFDKSIKEFCKVENYILDKKELGFRIVNNSNKRCIAIFPIPFSYNNKFINMQYLGTCDTFRVQYYFHGCIVDTSIEVILKKNNLFLYPYYSLKDYIENKRLKII